MGIAAAVAAAITVAGDSDLHASARLAAATVAGTITDAVTGAAVVGAKVKLAGSPLARTDVDGTFTVAAQGAGQVRGWLRRRGYFPRRLYIGLPEGAVDLDVGLIPQGDEFDLVFYDHVFRGTGRRGTQLWTDPEIDVEIWLSEFEYEPDRALYRVVAPVSSAFSTNAQSVVREEIVRLTGGRVRVGKVSLRVHFGDGTLSIADMRPPGVLRIAVVHDPGRPQFSLIYSSCGGGVPCEGIIDIHPLHAGGRAMILHELGHVLGWDHPLGRERVPLPSLMGPTPEPDYPTEHDLLHGPILYSRPSGSLSPDKDPRPDLARRDRRVRRVLDRFG